MPGKFEVINDLEMTRKGMNIARESIEFISLICKIIKPKYVLDIGTYNGYSALWLSLYSENVVSLEIDRTSVETAENNFFQAGASNIKVITADARKSLLDMNEKFDIILIDAQKDQYVEYLKLSMNLLSENGIVFADNTVSHRDKLKGFFEYLENSNFYFQELQIGKGLMVIAKSL